MIRLLRILRILKIVRFLKQLYLLAYGFASAAMATFWVTILMFASLYICSIVLVKTVGQVDKEDPNHDFLQERFGTIPRTMLMLFEVMSNPDLEQYRPLFGSHP